MAPQAAIIVGGGSGIGKATVAYFLRKGVSVALADRNDSSHLIPELQAQATADAKVISVLCDVASDASLENLVKEASDKLGRIDFAVNTAGVTGPTVEAHLLSDADWNQLMSIDLEGTWRFSKAMIHYWRAQEPRIVRDDSSKNQIWKPVEQRGALVNVASSLGSEGKALLAAYCAAKHGVIGLSKALALENAPHGIRVNTISPGLVFTPLFNEWGDKAEETKALYLQDQPMKRFAHPSEIASAIYFTCSDGASFMTGADWGPDGGSHIQ